MSGKELDSAQISAGIDQQTLERLAHLFGLCLYKLNFDTNDINLTLNTVRITGHELDSLPNNDDTKDSMIFEDDRQLVSSSIGSIVSGQKDHYHIEYRMYREDSSIVWIDEVGLISEYDKDGRPLYMSAIAADMSRLRWTEDKACAMEDEVRRLNASLDDHSLAEENRLLRAANAASAMIVGGYHQDYEFVLHQAVQMLGECLQANYAGIWRNVKSDAGLCCFLRTHWTNVARTVGAENNGVHFRYDDFFPGWHDRLAEKHYAVLDGPDLPREFCDVCGIQYTNAVMFTPFYLHGDFWGMIGFARGKELPFAAFEAETIMTGANIIAHSISRNETFGKINLARNKAEADTLAKGEFLSRMSHEMRTPLNAVIGMTNIAIKEKEPQKVTEYLKKIESSSQLLLNVINDVLDISKIEAGKLETVNEPFDFAVMLRNAENIVRVKIDEKNQRFTVYDEINIPVMIISDEKRLLQVVVNLLNNATKFTPDHGEISLTATQKNIGEDRARLRVEVRDNGIGLTQEQQKRLFTAFEQADGSITRKYGGTGLGLAICKKILNALGGDIWVKSKPDQGACFFFELDVSLGGPVGDTVVDETQEQQALEKAEKDTMRDWSGRTILLAEDVEINREIVEIMLSETGVNILSVENGKDAVDMFFAEPDRFDLILMDVQMPVLNGLSATRQIRSLPVARAGFVPIIAMTANAFKEDIDDCINAGMNEHIAKPLDEEGMFEVLDKYLGVRE